MLPRQHHSFNQCPFKNCTFFCMLRLSAIVILYRFLSILMSSANSEIDIAHATSHKRSDPDINH